jgi:ferredoxin
MSIRGISWGRSLDALAEDMRAIVDPDRCEGNARCLAAAPQLFDLDDNDVARVLLDEVPPSMADEAREAAEACPRMAITLAE